MTFRVKTIDRNAHIFLKLRKKTKNLQTSNLYHKNIDISKASMV